jgi:hypothetical protein
MQTAMQVGLDLEHSTWFPEATTAAAAQTMGGNASDPGPFVDDVNEPPRCQHQFDNTCSVPAIARQI